MANRQRILVFSPWQFMLLALATVQIVPLSSAIPTTELPNVQPPSAPQLPPETNGIDAGSQDTAESVTTAARPGTTTTSTTTTTTTTTGASSGGAAAAAPDAAAPAPAGTDGAAAEPPAPAAPAAAAPAAPATTAAPETPAAPATTPPAATEASYDDLDDFLPGTNHTYHIEGTGVQQAQIDDHKYYESKFVPQGKDFWVDLDRRPTNSVVQHDMLSEAHRRAARVPLHFDFPFYGHIIRNITIATGGFLYTGDYLHSWLAATQYIAPLMANFDTTITKDSVIKYSANATSLTVQWEKVPLQDAVNNAFSFQVTIHQSGNVVFAYRDVPVDISGIQTTAHPVKVGMSDAYIIDRTIFYVKRKTIYEYHRIDMKEYTISNNTALLFTAQPTCVSLRSCDKCLNHPSIDFKCAWCQSTNSCSDGMDRYRQSWLESRCDSSLVKNASKCGMLPPPPVVAGPTLPPPTEGVITPSVSTDVANSAGAAASAAAVKDESSKQGAAGMSSSAVASVVALVILVVAIGGWVVYAYLFPHSTSGQILIRYRPSQWRMRRGEARYTAASIHM